MLRDGDAVSPVSRNTDSGTRTSRAMTRTTARIYRDDGPRLADRIA